MNEQNSNASDIFVKDLLEILDENKGSKNYRYLNYLRKSKTREEIENEDYEQELQHKNKGFKFSQRLLTITFLFYGLFIVLDSLPFYQFHIDDKKFMAISYAVIAEVISLFAIILSGLFNSRKTEKSTN